MKNICIEPQCEFQYNIKIKKKIRNFAVTPVAVIIPYTETRPGLVALYDIRPGNGVGLFLPRSPHGANSISIELTSPLLHCATSN